MYTAKQYRDSFNAIEYHAVYERVMIRTLYVSALSVAAQVSRQIALAVGDARVNTDDFRLIY